MLSWAKPVPVGALAVAFIAVLAGLLEHLANRLGAENVHYVLIGGRRPGPPESFPVRLHEIPGSPALRCDKSTPAKTPASLQEFIQCQADSSELRNGGTTSLPNKVRVCIDSGSSTISFANLKIGDPIKVTVTATYHWVPLIGDAIGIASSTISGSSTMRLEAAPTNLSQGCYPT